MTRDDEYDRRFPKRAPALQLKERKTGAVVETSPNGLMSSREVNDVNLPIAHPYRHTDDSQRPVRHAGHVGYGAMPTISGNKWGANWMSIEDTRLQKLEALVLLDSGAEQAMPRGFYVERTIEGHIAFSQPLVRVLGSLLVK